MEPAVEKMEARLKLWGMKVHKLAAKTQRAGAPVSFEDLMYIDELKALHAIAQSKLIEFKAAGDTERGRLEDGMRSALNDLEAAFKKPMP